ncbi:MAG TPA: GNAT family N-acetyltransferase [Kribbella sp.]|uniref:GNAT family N-acetyltransferase n=1 Tax=Kribbella sp. TaxID=1871183 RepID=UPI002D77668E|nr:GNAT family N-acetyltransferase [Kribbella sp.]HET6296925.1 GNAT family N-acetyltransferase [Kribbella sp.]
MTDAIEIRPATMAEVDGVVASCTALFAEDAGTRDLLRNPGWPATYGGGWCADLIADPGALVLVAVGQGKVGGHLVGTFSEPSDMWIAPRAELVSMYVAAPLRGAGVGGRLVDGFVTWARDRGATRLQVDAYASNEAALGLYQSRGFSPQSITLTLDR